MTEREKMLAGQLYNALDKELVAGRQWARTLTPKYNYTTEEQQEERESLLQQLLGSVGKGVFVEPPFRCDYGSQIYVGDIFTRILIASFWMFVLLPLDTIVC